VSLGGALSCHAAQRRSRLLQVTHAGVSATGVPPSAATGALGEPAGRVPVRGGELLVTRAGVLATDVTPSEANGATGEPACSLRPCVGL